jgi:hypothetical protein
MTSICNESFRRWADDRGPYQASILASRLRNVREFNCPTLIVGPSGAVYGARHVSVWQLTPRSYDHAYEPGAYGVCRRCGEEKHPNP